MKNYVLLYHFDEKEREKQFEQSVKQEFSRHQVDETGPFKYLGFAAGEEPGVVDQLNAFLTSMGLGYGEYYGPRDYVALYFSRDKDPDNIKRQLLIGTQEMVDKDAETTSTDAHNSSIQNLLQYNYLKGQ